MFSGSLISVFQFSCKLPEFSNQHHHVQYHHVYLEFTFRSQFCYKHWDQISDFRISFSLSLPWFLRALQTTIETTLLIKSKNNCLFHALHTSISQTSKSITIYRDRYFIKWWFPEEKREKQVLKIYDFSW